MEDIIGRLNRNRITVQIGGPWQLYTPHALPGWEMLGTVDRGADAGALARSRVGVYCQINAGAVRSLDQRKVKAAIDAAGSR